MIERFIQRFAWVILSFVLYRGDMELTQKHIKLLDLIRTNKYDVPTLAKKSGFEPLYVSRLLEGKIEETGDVGKRFQAELSKVDRDVESRISRKTQFVREKLVNKLIQWIDATGGGAEMDTKTKHKQLVDAINAVNKSMPYMVNVQQYNWKEGMSAEEAVNEFKRLKAMATKSALRRRVQELIPGGSAEGDVLDGQTNEGYEDTQDTVL